MVKVSTFSKTGLRELRLWHWREALFRRKLAKAEADICLQKFDNALADQHIKFVQTLNNFFPIDDTAEQDNAAS